jgi:hypothetical protein
MLQHEATFAHLGHNKAIFDHHKATFKHHEVILITIKQLLITIKCVKLISTYLSSYGSAAPSSTYGSEQ